EQYASWPKAIGRYHSAAPHLHMPYRSRVLKRWARVCHRSEASLLAEQRSTLAALSTHPLNTAAPIKAAAPSAAHLIIRQVAYHTVKPMNAFYASLNRRTSGKIYQADLCRGHVFPKHSYLLKVSS
ncbi:MAG: hypothetical protein LBQ26_00960, partial [Holosporales bacterium]|nr:hypothetical protein [Holosporales bacterium]